MINNLCTGFSPKTAIKMGCVTPYDALLILANLNLIINDETTDPLFEARLINGCYVLNTNKTYMKLFSVGPQTFIEEEIIAQINPFIASNGSSCPNAGDAEKVIYFLK